MREGSDERLVSTDGSDWTLLGKQTVQMPATVYVGLAVTSHDPSYISTGTFSNVSSARRPHQSAADGRDYRSFAGSIFPAATSLAVTAAASDPDGIVNWVTSLPTGRRSARRLPRQSSRRGQRSCGHLFTHCGGHRQRRGGPSPARVITVAAALAGECADDARVHATADYATNVTSCRRAVASRHRIRSRLLRSLARDLGKPTP